jgi:cardiolipin synthase
MEKSSSSKILTIPNLITLVRALGVPVFLWLYLQQHQTGWAFFALWIGAITDYLDGKIARLLNQTSDLGAIMDPAIDRLYIFATLIAFMIKGVWPLYLGIALIGRDLALGIILIFAKSAGQKFMEVTYLGKAATFNLLYALPLFLLKNGSGWHLVAGEFAWAFAIWGSGLYLITGFSYAKAMIQAL